MRKKQFVETDDIFCKYSDWSKGSGGLKSKVKILNNKKKKFFFLEAQSNGDVNFSSVKLIKE